MNLDDLHRLYNLGKLAIFVAGIAIGIIAFFYVYGRLLLRALAAKRWPKTEGTIVRSEVDVTDLGAGDPDIAPSVSRYPIVEYSYEADGRNYQSRTLYIADAILNLEADEMVAKYPRGAKVAVYYNPADPADCALDCHLPQANIRALRKAVVAILIIGLFCILAFTPVASLLRKAMAPFPGR